MAAGRRCRQAARFGGGAERGSLLVGGRSGPLTRAVGGGTLRERHTLIGQTLLLRIGERRTRRAAAVLAVGCGRGRRRRRQTTPTPRAGSAASATNPTTIPTFRDIRFVDASVTRAPLGRRDPPVGGIFREST